MPDHHDPLCTERLKGYSAVNCGVCAALSLKEKVIRADERSYSRTAAAAHRDHEERLAALRERVDALPTRGVGARVVDGELVTHALVERDEVIALFRDDEAKPVVWPKTLHVELEDEDEDGTQ
jgi:hypothetical protein